jgi:cytochrome c5
MSKLRLCWLLLACLPFAAMADDKPAAARTMKLYKMYCDSCHGAGVQKAPVTGKLDDWADRLMVGVDGLLEETKKGLKNMPPKGGCNECTDADLQAIIEMMTQ